MKHFILGSLMLLSSAPAFAADTIAEAATVESGYVIKLQLSDQQADAYTPCKFGTLAARIVATRVGDANSTQRMSLGCWIVNRDGSVEYSSKNERTGQFDYAKMDASNFKKLSGFKSWGEYMNM